MAIMDMHTQCERCGRPLPNGSPDARICTFECTFCAACTSGPLGEVCPNCDGNLVLRPTRPPHLVEKYPPVDASPSTGNDTSAEQVASP
jgi:hypothetical protein